MWDLTIKAHHHNAYLNSSPTKFSADKAEPSLPEVLDNDITSNHKNGSPKKSSPQSPNAHQSALSSSHSFFPTNESSELFKDLFHKSSSSSSLSSASSSSTASSIVYNANPNNDLSSVNVSDPSSSVPALSSSASLSVPVPSTSASLHHPVDGPTSAIVSPGAPSSMTSPSSAIVSSYVPSSSYSANHNALGSSRTASKALNEPKESVGLTASKADSNSSIGSAHLSSMLLFPALNEVCVAKIFDDNQIRIACLLYLF